jgi:hypothetical protein
LRVGSQDLTIFQNPAAVATRALDAVIALSQRRLAVERLPRRRLVCSPPSRPVPVIDVPFELITRETLHLLEAYWETGTK